MKQKILIFLLLIISSPWLLVVAKNSFSDKINFPRRYQFLNQYLIDEINTLRGQSGGQLVINKFTWTGRELLSRYLETFDFHYLFMEGDLDLKKSTRSSGPLLFSLAPFVFGGFYFYFKKKSLKLPLLILFLPSLGVFFDQHWETLSRLPFIFGLTWMATTGLLIFFKKKGYLLLKGVFLFMIVFEWGRFLHYFFLHYPNV